MKRMICMVAVLVLFVSLVCPVLAAGNTFVPSISNKDHPDLVPTPDGYPGEMIDDNGNRTSNLDEGCIVITPVSDAETSTQIPDDARETLLDVYEKLSGGTMKLPYEKVDPGIDPDKMVIRDLFDVSFLCQEHPEMLKNGEKLKLTFDLGVAANLNVITMVYSNGEWVPAVNVVNNGNGTVTVTLDRVGAVAFAVPVTAVDAPVPETGDIAGGQLVIWGAVCFVSVAALVAILVLNRKKHWV